MFTVADNTDRHITEATEVMIERKNPHTSNSMVWTMSFADLVDLQSAIATYIAGDRLG